MSLVMSPIPHGALETPAQIAVTPTNEYVVRTRRSIVIVTRDMPALKELVTKRSIAIVVQIKCSGSVEILVSNSVHIPPRAVFPRCLA